MAQARACGGWIGTFFSGPSLHNSATRTDSGNFLLNGNEEVNHRLRLWIDTDAGVDDAQGLMLALKDPTCDLVGISCVGGNCEVQKVLVNVARVLTLCGREDVPFFRGAAEPLLNDFVESDYHGKDGMGDAPQVYPTKADVRVGAAERDAVSALLAASHVHAGELVVVAIGPLTNLALACKLDPSFPGRVRALVVMGGAEAVGNTTPTTEFNFWFDPEAASVVLKKFGVACADGSPRVTIVTWECTERHSLQWSWLDRWVAKDNTRGVFMKAIMSKIMTKERLEKPVLGWQPCDSLAVALALRPGLLRDSSDVCADVELTGRLCRGQSVFDWNGLLKRPANARLVRTIDQEAFAAMMDALTD